jgi:hypothetical protein
VSRKLAIAISTTRSMVYDRPWVIGYSISVARWSTTDRRSSTRAVLILSGSLSRMDWASVGDSCSRVVVCIGLLLHWNLDVVGWLGGAQEDSF